MEDVSPLWEKVEQYSFTLMPLIPAPPPIFNEIKIVNFNEPAPLSQMDKNGPGLPTKPTWEHRIIFTRRKDGGWGGIPIRKVLALH